MRRIRFIKKISRRGVWVAGAVLLFAPVYTAGATGIEPPAGIEVIHEWRERPDLLDDKSPDGLRVVQMTTNPEIASHHVYTEAQIITFDSKKFVFYRGRDLWVCDMADDFGIRRLTDEKGVKGPSVSPCGKWLYYLVDTTKPGAGTLTLKRVSLINFTRETLLVVDGPIPGTPYRPSRVYGLSSISSDGERLCTSAFLGDGKTPDGLFGLMVFDLVKRSVKIVFTGKGYSNMHPQYCRSTDPVLSHDIMIQHDVGFTIGADGRRAKRSRDYDIDLHVVADNAQKYRDVPIGRNGVEMIQGHQQWRGRTGTILSSMHGLNAAAQKEQKRKPIVATPEAIPEPVWPIYPKQILLAGPVPTDETTAHRGSNVPGGSYVDITRKMTKTGFRHFSSDISGMHIVTDSVERDEGRGENVRLLYVGSLSKGENPELKVTYLLNSQSTGRGQPAHLHPFFSPDNRMAFFNSDVDGLPQIFMVTGYSFPGFE
ncbi:hypothetical protein ACFLT7_03500 [candidate division KSB1 bacterium]